MFGTSEDGLTACKLIKYIKTDFSSLQMVFPRLSETYLITKIYLFKYTENFTTIKIKNFR